MNQELKDWFFQQLKDCEDGKLNGPHKTMFLDTVEQGKHIPEFQEIFAKYSEWKKKELYKMIEIDIKNLKYVLEQKKLFPPFDSNGECEDCEKTFYSSNKKRCDTHTNSKSSLQYHWDEEQFRESISKWMEQLSVLY